MKKNISKIFIWFIAFSSIIFLSAFYAFNFLNKINNNSKNVQLIEKAQSENNNAEEIDVVSNSETKIVNNNKQEYLSDDGKTHTIYWAKGVKAPLMASDNSGKLNTNGYFERYYNKQTNSAGYVTETLLYESQFFQNNGYYDLNKNIHRMSNEKSYCYLCSASNLIYWWLNENSKYINTYINQIKLGNFVSVEGLVNIENLDIWNELLVEPLMVETDSLLTQEMTKSSLSKVFEETYIKRTSGYWMDRVIDHFINGYVAITDDRENSEDNFVKQIYGGYFYPIFNKTRLTHRYTQVDYNFYNTNLLKFIKEGKGLSLSYYTPTGSHAITVWGVEYDSNNNLKRLYVTDSDDYSQTTARNTDKIRGLHSFEVKKDPISNQIYFTTNIDKNAKIGSKLQSFVTFDLAQDVWEQKLSDTSSPQTPIITEEPKDINKQFSSNTEIITLGASAKIEDSGYLSYQWFKSETNGGVGVLIEGADKSTYKPLDLSEKVNYYYCEITNNKNGKLATSRTRYAKVDISSKYLDVKTPKLKMDPQIIKYKQYQKPNIIKVQVNKFDDAEITYQWYCREYGDSSYSPGSAIVGEISATLVPLTNTAYNSSMKYYCVVTAEKMDATGIKKVTVISNVITVKVEPREFYNAVSPVIVEESKPKDLYNTSENVTLFVNAKSADEGNLTYQWYKANDLYSDGTKILNETSNVLNLTLQSAGKFYYYCVVSNTNNLASSQKRSISQTSVMCLNVQGEEVVLSSNNNLTSLSVSNHTIKPSFKPDVLEYSLTVENNIESVTINAVKEHDKAKVSGTGTKTLQVGLNTFEIKVVAENGTSKIYKIKIIRNAPVYVPSSNNNLTSLSVSNHTIKPNFKPDVLEYSLTVENNIESVTINAVKEHDKAQVSGTGTKTLQVGLNTFEIKVVAENGTSKIYKINITRNALDYVPSDNNYLSNLEIQNFSLNPIFNKNITYYTVNVTYLTTNVAILTETEDSNAEVNVYNVENLVVGNNEISIIVSAENGSEKTYTINVIRAEARKNNNLTSIVINGNNVLPNFSEDVLEYFVDVPNNCENLEISGIVDVESGAKVEVSGNNNLKVGNNIITITVTAENGASKVYSINVTRKEEVKVNKKLPIATLIYIGVSLVGFAVICGIVIVVKSRRRYF